MRPRDLCRGLPGWREGLRFFLALAGLGCGLIPRVACADERAEEYAVKADYLLNFAKFVGWPTQALPAPKSPLTLCIAGTDPFGDTLETIRDKSVRDRPLVIRRLSRLEDPSKCQVLFVGDSESARVRSILARLKNSPILTVSDIPGFADAGGMIGLVNVGQPIRFQINLHAVQKANIKISSQLLKLARIVDDRGQD
jgi:hypothetical protein